MKTPFSNVAIYHCISGDISKNCYFPLRMKTTNKRHSVHAIGFSVSCFQSHNCEYGKVATQLCRVELYILGYMPIHLHKPQSCGKRGKQSGMHDCAYRNVGLNSILCVLAFTILKKCSFHIGRPNAKQ